MKKFSLTLMAALLLASAVPIRAAAQNTAASEMSALSMLPVAVSAAAPVALLSTGGAFVVVAVSAVAEGTVWVLERASDGARFSITLAGAAVGGVVVSAGVVLATTVISTGVVLSAAGKAVAYIPNEVGKALLYNERLTYSRGVR
jgi:hypothetical protein